MRLIKTGFLLLLWFLTSDSWAQIPKPKKNTYVNDIAGVLTKAQETELNKEIFKIERKHDVQLAIVLVNKVPAAYDIEEFAVLIGKRWGVGKGQKGMVYVAAIKQRKQRLEVARKLDEYFPYTVSLELLERVKPGFREKNYSAGLHELVAGIDDILPLSESENKRQQAQADSVQAVVKQAAIAKEKADAKASEESSRSFWKGVAIFLSVILGIVLLRKIFTSGSSTDAPDSGSAYYVGDGNYDSPGYTGSRRYNRYGSGGYRSSGSNLSNFAAGAAAGFAASSLQQRADEERLERERREEQERREEEERRDREQRELEELMQEQEKEAQERAANVPSNWGNWGGGSSSGGSSSGSSGFTTGSSSGATSDW